MNHREVSKGASFFKTDANKMKHSNIQKLQVYVESEYE